MPNMGYCRFRNTLTDLQDCLNHIDEDDLSREERDARIDLIGVCREIIKEAEFFDLENEDEEVEEDEEVKE